MSVKEAVRTPDKSAAVYAQRARYVCNENGFDFSYPPVPTRQFLAEREQAFDEHAASGLVELDASDALGTAYAATTPSLLCRYIKVRAGERLSSIVVASGEVIYVIAGRGASRNGADEIAWSVGDVFCFPGGVETVHTATDDALLFSASDAPLFAFAGIGAPATSQSAVEAVIWSSVEIDRRLQQVYDRAVTAQATGASVQFSTRRTEPNFTTTPFINTAINTLATECDQRPHRHNGVAVTLAIQGEGIHSMIDGERIDWVSGAAQITPATALHSHHNRGNKRMRSLVIQDEGLHIYTRTPGFSFD
jgi:gentisate 1,2-dioxygenase